MNSPDPQVVKRLLCYLSIERQAGLQAILLQDISKPCVRVRREMNGVFQAVALQKSFNL
jgi:hypothetical protein